jgi:excisionase family DNA binding protein
MKVGNRERAAIGHSEAIPILTQNTIIEFACRLERIERQLQLLSRNSGQEMKQSQPPIGGIKVAAEETGLSTSTIYKLVSDNAIPHSKRRGRLYFSRENLRTWMMTK